MSSEEKVEAEFNDILRTRPWRLPVRRNDESFTEFVNRALDAVYECGKEDMKTKLRELIGALDEGTVKELIGQERADLIDSLRKS